MDTEEPDNKKVNLYVTQKLIQLTKRSLNQKKVTKKDYLQLTLRYKNWLKQFTTELSSKIATGKLKNEDNTQFKFNNATLSYILNLNFNIVSKN